MKNKLILLVLAILLIGLSKSFGQGFKPPSEGKAVVYFTRATNVIPSLKIRYYDIISLLMNFLRRTISDMSVIQESIILGCYSKVYFYRWKILCNCRFRSR